MYDSAPMITASVSGVLLDRVTISLTRLRMLRYPHASFRDVEVEIQGALENNCAVFLVWHVLSNILDLRTCDNQLARALRSQWLPFLIWAVGGESLPLRARDSSELFSPNDQKVRQTVQFLYSLARKVGRLHTGTLSGGPFPNFVDAAWRLPNRDQQSIRWFTSATL